MKFSILALSTALLASSAMASSPNVELKRLAAAVVTTTSSSATSTSTPVVYSGRAQYNNFDNDQTAPACGKYYNNTDMVLGIDYRIFKNGDAVCGRKVRITAPNGESHTGKVVDSCSGGCGKGGVLLSKGLFQKFYALRKGEFQAQWQFI